MFIIRFKKRLLLFIIFSFHNTQTYSQTNQYKGWSEFEYSFNLDKKWSLALSQHFRLKEDFRIVDTYITESDIEFIPFKKIKFSGQLRYYYRNDNSGGIQGFENMFRYRIGVEKKINFNPLNFELRLAFQNRFSLDRKNRFKKRIRIRPMTEIKIKNWKNNPRIFFEYFDEIGGRDQFAYRYGISTKINIEDNQRLTLRYFYQTHDEKNTEDFYTNVISLKYSFN